MRAETKHSVLRHEIFQSNQWIMQPNNLGVIFDDIASKIKEINQLNSNSEDDLNKIKEFLFIISWRSSEIPWSIKDAEKIKTIFPWKYIDFISNFMVKNEPEYVQSFIKDLIKSDDFGVLLEQVDQVRKLSNKEDKTKIKQDNKKSWPTLEKHLDVFIDNFYVDHIKQHLQIATNEICNINSDVTRAALLEILSIIGESAKKINPSNHPNIPCKVLADIRDAIEHQRNQFVRRRFDEIGNDQEGSVINDLMKELQKLNSDNDKSFPILTHLASKSVLSFKELNDLKKDLPAEQLDYFLKVFNGDANTKFPSKKDFYGKISNWNLANSPLENKLMEFYERKAKGNKSVINLNALTLDSEIEKAINNVDSKINQFIEVLKNCEHVNEEVSHLAIKYRFKSVAVASARLINEEFASFNDKESVLPDNLIILGKLRNLIAHRPFELDREHFQEIVEKIAAFMRLDLKEVKNKIKNSSGTNKSESTIEKFEATDLYEILHDNKDEIFRLQTRFGIENNVNIIGRYSYKPCYIGTQDGLELLIVPNKTPTFLDQMMFEMELSGLLKLKVTTSTEKQLQNKTVKKITKQHYDQLLESKTELSKIYLYINDRKNFAPGRYNYLNPYNQVIHGQTPEELWGQKSVSWIFSDKDWKEFDEHPHKKDHREELREFVRVVDNEKRCGKYITPKIERMYVRCGEYFNWKMRISTNSKEELLEDSYQEFLSIGKNLSLQNKLKETYSRLQQLENELQKNREYFSENKKHGNECGAEINKGKLDEITKNRDEIRYNVKGILASDDFEKLFDDYLYENCLQIFNQVQFHIEFHSNRLKKNEYNYVERISTDIKEQATADEKTLLKPQLDKFRNGNYADWSASFTKWFHDKFEEILLQEIRKEFIEGLYTASSPKKRKATDQDALLSSTNAHGNMVNQAHINSCSSSSLSSNAMNININAQVEGLEEVAASSHRQAFKRSKKEPESQKTL